MTRDEKLKLAHRFLTVLSPPNEDVVRSVVNDHMVWSFPESSVISGEAHGIAGVMARAQKIAAHDVHVEIRRTVYGYNGVAVFLHNTGSKGRRLFDEHLVAVFSFRDDKIARLDTFPSDVPMVEAFFG